MTVPDVLPTVDPPIVAVTVLVSPAPAAGRLLIVYEPLPAGIVT